MAVRERDVAAREKTDNLESLSYIYDDFREDLRDAKEECDMEDIERIRDEMKQTKRRRIDISND